MCVCVCICVHMCVRACVSVCMSGFLISLLGADVSFVTNVSRPQGSSCMDDRRRKRKHIQVPFISLFIVAYTFTAVIFPGLKET